jgi:hypothetical protein
MAGKGMRILAAAASSAPVDRSGDFRQLTFIGLIGIKDALRLGTLDARLFYHAGMIARAAGDREGAADFLRRAIKLNPHFDPWQSQVARKALEEITGVRASPSQGPLLASRTIR